MSDTSAKIKEMAQLTILSNRLSEVHEKNLKMYPFVFFNGVTSAELLYNLSRSHSIPGDSQSFSIHYNITVSEKDVVNDNLDKRCKALEMSVHNLLWNNIDVTIKLNDLEIFRGSNGRK